MLGCRNDKQDTSPTVKTNAGYINKKGHKLSAYIVQKYGTYLRPSIYEHINAKPMTPQQALIMEEKLALDLRRQGYAGWFN